MDLTGIIWANMGTPWYRVEIPPGTEAGYQLAAPIALSFAVASIGLWLVRSRSIRKTWGRLLLWVALVGLAVGYSAWWVWSHRGGTFQSEIFGAVAVDMPYLWPLFCAVLIGLGWWTVRPPKEHDDDPPNKKIE